MRKLLTENEYARIEFLEDDEIVVAIWKLEIVDLEAAQNAVQTRKNVTEGHDYPLLIDARNLKSITKEARQYLSSPEGSSGALAAAILINSKVSSIIANFFLRLNKPPVPSKVFSDEIKARNWLGQFVYSN